MSVVLRLQNFIPLIPNFTAGDLSQVWDLVYWTHQILIYMVMWSFAMMFYYPCNLYYIAQHYDIIVLHPQHSSARTSHESIDTKPK